jgi:hypothetical protein
MLSQQREEVRPTKPEGIHRRAAPDGRISPTAPDQRLFAKLIARTKNRQRNLLAVLDLLDYPGTAVDKNVAGVRFLPFPDNHVAEFEVFLLERRPQAVSALFWQKPEKRRAIQDLVLVLRHGAPVGGKIHRTKRATNSEK